MKKICLLLCLLMPLCLFVACGDDAEDPQDTTPTKEGIKIDVGESLTIGVNEEKQLNALNLKNNSKTTVIWSSDNPAIVSVDYSGKIVGLSDGSAVITAKTPDDAYTATCKVTVSSVLTNIAFESPNLTMEKGSELTLNPVLTPANITGVSLTWVSGDPKVATVANGVVKAISNGSTTIVVHANDGMISAVCTINVTTTLTDVELSEHSLIMDKGATQQLIATLIPADASDGKLTWTSSNPEVVNVSSDGTLTALTGGAANITVTSEKGITDTCNVVVTSPVTGVTLDRTELTIGVGEVAQLIATIAPEDANTTDVIWSCTDLSVLAVDAEGKLMGQKAGVVEVTVTTLDGYFTATCTVTVINAATEIVFESEGGDLEIGKTLTLLPILTPPDADAPILTWTSSDETVATVDENGMITALKLGDAVITATATNGVTATYRLRVVALEIKIEQIVVEAMYDAKVGKTFKLGISLKPLNCTETYRLIASDTKMIRINADGSLTPLKAGLAYVDIVSASGDVSESCLIMIEELSDEERDEHQKNYEAKAEALRKENEDNLADITKKYDEQIGKISEYLSKLAFTDEETYRSKRDDLEKRLNDAQAELDKYTAEGNQELIAVYTQTRDALKDQITKLDSDWKVFSLLQENLSDLQTSKANELAAENVRYKAAMDSLKAEYAFLF